VTERLPDQSDRIRIDSLGLTYHTVKPLAEAGIFYLDQLQEMPVDRIASMVGGKKTLPTLMKLLDREVEYNRWAGHYDVDVKDEDGQVVATYPAGQLRQIMALTGTARNFGFGTPQEMAAAFEAGRRTNPITGEVLSFDINDVARYRYQTDSEKRLKRKVAAEMGETVLPKISEEKATAWNEQVDAMVARYATDYDTSQWNQTDWDNMRILSGMKLRVQQLQGILGNYGPSETAQLANVTRNIAQEIAGLVAQIRLLEDEIGLSLRARIKRSAEQAPEDAFKEFVKGAKELVADRASIAMHCGVRLGIIIPHFPRHVVTDEILLTCPRCGERVHWPIVTQKMLDGYIEAEDFVPEGAPEGMLR
jgi:hypothetical protein